MQGQQHLRIFVIKPTPIIFPKDLVDVLIHLPGDFLIHPNVGRFVLGQQLLAKLKE